MSAAPEQPTTEPHDQNCGEPPLDSVLDLIRYLRAHCPWDGAQTPSSLLPYLLEEAHEVVDAVAAGNDEDLAGELGDLLLHVGFQIVLAEERSSFGAAAVVHRLEAKMRRRHPQLYGAGEAQGWESLKAEERRGRSLVAGLSKGLDPLSRAHRLQDRVSAVGFDWADARGAFAKVAEELEEVNHALEAEPSPLLEEELGDLLFAVVNLTRLAGVHAMNALQRANRKFAHRFQALERLASERGLELAKMSLAELDALWDEVKSREPRDAGPGRR